MMIVPSVHVSMFRLCIPSMNLPLCVLKDWVLLDFAFVLDTWDLLTLKVWDSFCLEEDGVEWDEDLMKLICGDDEEDVLFP